MRVQDGIEVVTPEIAQAYRQAESLVFPSSVRTIESFCFRQFHNLTTVEFEEGVETIGTCAFQGCNALRSVRLPQSLHEFGQGGTFRDCSNLVEVTFNPVTGDGDCLPLRCFLFANCHHINGEVLQHENRLRRSFHLCRIFDRIAQEELFGEWVDGYRAACHRLAKVDDWRNADEGVLRFLVAERDNGITDIGEGATAMAGGAMRPENFRAYREIASAISEVGRTNDWDQILPILREKREQFFRLFRHANNAHPWLVFNRIVAGLLPSFVVNVADFEDLNNCVYGWLTQRQFMRNRDFQREEWFELSHEVRVALSSWLEPHDIFECGPFAWALAERNNDGMRDHDERIPMFRQVVDDALVIEEKWFARNAQQ